MKTSDSHDLPPEAAPANAQPAAADAAAVPEGFIVMRMPANPFIDGIGPLYGRLEDDRFVMGIRVEQRHCNPMGNCHGGMLATFCDMLLPMAAHRTTAEVRGRFLPTISLQLDYMNGAPLGHWVQGEADILQVTRNLVFSQGLITCDGRVVARPFPKFFNMDEPDAPKFEMDDWVEVSDKRDGSLGILYFWDDRPYIATRGAFMSQQARHATEVFHKKFGEEWRKWD